jgi:enoyl-CoA hydratase
VSADVKELTFQTLLYRKENGIAWITLNRPEKLNAINYLMREDLRVALADVASDDEVRVAIVDGAGRAFSTGADLEGDAAPADVAHLYDGRDASHLFYEAVWQNPKPIIAAVHGYVLARGGDLAALCDITLCSEDAQFGYPVLWQTPAMPISLWPWTLGLKLTKELVLTGRMLDAQEALRLGLVNRVVPRHELSAAAVELATVIANGADKRIQKSAVNRLFDEHLGVRSAFEDQWRAKEDEPVSEFYGGDDPVNVAFRRKVEEAGLRAALNWRERRMKGHASLDE